MLITYVLVVHLILAALVLAGFSYRYIQAFRLKNYPEKGRNSLFAGSLLLVISGVLLSVIGKLPLRGLCLDSLGLITALLVMEFGLRKLGHVLYARDNSDS